MLHILSEKKKRAFYEANRGRTATVIFENDIVDGRMHGFTENYIRVSAPYDPLMIYEKQPVVLCEVTDTGIMTSADVLV